MTYPPHVEEGVKEIYKACKGLGTNENTIIRVLTSMNDMDRELLMRRYKEVHSKDLGKHIDSETSGDFGFLARLLCLPLNEMEALILNKACSGAGTNELLYPAGYWLRITDFLVGDSNACDTRL
jgi:annexin A13